MALLLHSLVLFWAIPPCSFPDCVQCGSEHSVCRRPFKIGVWDVESFWRERNFICVDGCLAGSVGLGGQGVATGHSI